MSCSPITKDNFFAVITNLGEHTAFILNKGSHWYSIRNIYEQWFNLNSFLSEPNRIPTTDLCAELENLMNKGLTIYTVQGSFPVTPIGRPCSVDGRWIRVQLNEEEQLRAAIEASIREQQAVKAQYQELLASASNLPSGLSAGAVQPVVVSSSSSQFNSEMVSSLNAQFSSMQQQFENCLKSMETLDQRLQVLESNTKIIVQKQALQRKQ